MDSDSENLGSNPGPPAKAKLLGLQRNYKNSSRTKWGYRLTSRCQSLPSIFNELRACSDLPGHMMGTWATLRRPSPKHALFTPVVRIINTIGTRISLAQ